MFRTSQAIQTRIFHHCIPSWVSCYILSMKEWHPAYFYPSVELFQSSFPLILNQTNAEHAEKVQNKPVFAAEKTFTRRLQCVSLVVKATPSIFPDSFPQYLFHIASKWVHRICFTICTQQMPLSSSHNPTVLFNSLTHYGAHGYASVRFHNEWWFWTTLVGFFFFRVSFWLRLSETANVYFRWKFLNCCT